MDIYFLCPKCETKFAIDESAAGLVFRCTNCNQKIVVPEPPQPAPPTPIEAPSSPIPLSPAVTPAAPTSPAIPSATTKTQKIPEELLPQQPPPSPPPPASPAAPAPKVVFPQIAQEPTVAPPETAEKSPSTIQLLRDAQSRLEQQLAQRSAALDSANQRIAALQLDFQKKSAALEEQLAAAQQTIAAGQQAHSKLESQLAEARQALRQAQSEAEARVVALATEKAELQRRLQSQESHLRQLEALAAQAPAAGELTRLRDELKQRNAEIANLRLANEELAAARRESAQALAQIADEKSRLAAQLRQVTQELNALRARHASTPSQARIEPSPAVSQPAPTDNTARRTPTELERAEANATNVQQRPPDAPSAQSPPTDSQPEVAAQFPAPAPIFFLASTSNPPTVLPLPSVETPDLKEKKPLPLRSEPPQPPQTATKSAPSDAAQVNSQSTVAVAESPFEPTPHPPSQPSPDAMHVSNNLLPLLAFAGIATLLLVAAVWAWYVWGGNTTIDPAKFDRLIATSNRVEQLTRNAPNPMQLDSLTLSNLVDAMERELDSVQELADRGNERRLAEQFRSALLTYKDSLTLWNLARQNNNVVSLSEVRVRRLAAQYGLPRVRIKNRDEEFVEGNQAMLQMWKKASEQLSDANKFLRQHQSSQ